MKTSKKSNKKFIIWSIIGILALAAIISTFALPRRVNYTQVKATKGNLATYYSFSGSVEAKNRQTVFADKAMQIKDIKVTEGQNVTTDTVLMTTSMGEEIKSKIDGEVSSVYADENAQLMPGAKLIDIVNYSDLQLKVQVDEKDLSAVSKGRDAIVTVHALNKDFSSKIIEVSKQGEYLNGVTTFSATLSLPKVSDLRVGMSAEAKVLNQSVAGVIILPMSAIQFDANNTPYVLVKDGNKTPQQVGITIGINNGVYAEIKSGLKINDTVSVPTAKSPSSGFGPGSQMQQDLKNSKNSQNAPQESSGGGEE